MVSACVQCQEDDFGASPNGEALQCRKNPFWEKRASGLAAPQKSSRWCLLKKSPRPRPAGTSKKRRLQYGLTKFYGKVLEKKAAKLTPGKGLSPELTSASMAEEKYEEKLAEIQVQQEGSDLVAIVKKRKLTQGKRQTAELEAGTS